MKFLIPFLLLLSFFSCSQDEDTDSTEPITTNGNKNEIYYPPLGNSNWDTISLMDLNWNQTSKLKLDSFHIANNTRAFIVLHKGKIVIEEYWGKTISNASDFDQTSSWYWASAGKTLTSFLVGKAQELGHLTIDEKTSKYLGANWTSMNQSKEDLILIKHQLSMTTGLDYRIPSIDCTWDTCLIYKEDAGNQWYYHNAPYTLLESVVSNASNLGYNQFSEQHLESKIGMNGEWLKSGYNNVYWSSAKDAARFGLLIYSKGEWNGSKIMVDESYFNAMISSSQNINPSYGYLWWLNGKNSIMIPTITTSFNRSLAPSAPPDLIAAMGKNGQFISIVPSIDLVVVRMGEFPGNSLVPITFHDDMWKIIMEMIN